MKTPEIYISVTSSDLVRANYIALPGSNLEIILQRTTDGSQYENVDSALAQNWLQQPLKFCLHDDAPLQGISFYRFKFTDEKGAVSYSAMEEVRLISTNLAVTIDHGFSDGCNLDLHIYNAAKSSQMMVVIYDSLGHEISSFIKNVKEAGEQIVKLQLPERLQAGMYRVISAFSTSICENKLQVK